MNSPSLEAGFHRTVCRFCGSEEIFEAGSQETCSKCGKVLNNRPFAKELYNTTVYVRKPYSTFTEYCEDNWLTWIDSRNTDGYIWFKGGSDVWEKLSVFKIKFYYYPSTKYFNGPGWFCPVDNKLEDVKIDYDYDPRKDRFNPMGENASM